MPSQCCICHGRLHSDKWKEIVELVASGSSVSHMLKFPSEEQDQESCWAMRLCGFCIEEGNEHCGCHASHIDSEEETDEDTGFVETKSEEDCRSHKRASTVEVEDDSSDNDSGDGESSDIDLSGDSSVDNVFGRSADV
jgi:hypothetical protein